MDEVRVIQLGPISDRFDARLAAERGAVPLWREADRAAFLARHGAAVEALVTSSRYGCDAALLDALPNLRAICSFGVGYDAIDVEAARRRGVVVSNTPDVLNDCVADLALGLILDCARRLSEGDRFVRAGGWLAGDLPLGRQVTGKRLGIVGLGRIGRAVARRAQGFAMEVRYHNSKPAPGTDYRYEPSLPALARWADFLVLTCPGGPRTHHLISAEVLEALGPEGILINVARGSVVDEAALVRALEAGRLGGAGLDVYADEPNVPDALRRRDDVVLLPHVGSGTVETRLAMENLVHDNLAAFLAQGRLLTPV